MEALLDNVIWHALSGAQSRFAVGSDRARRYAPGFTPIVGFADPERPDFDALARHCAPGEHFYCESWSGTPPAGWQIDAETTMFKMVWDAGLPAADEAPEAVALDASHVPAAIALAELTKPGPFGPRTIELGEYFGLFESGELVAMAGERMHAGLLREISGVCTHPGQRGRGLAARLMRKLARRQMQRGETPFLHVMRDNTGAKRLYEQMGFGTRCETIVRVISRSA